MYSPEMREYLKEIKRYLVWRYGITDRGGEALNNREDWWEYTKRIIRSYPALCRKAESVGDIPCTPAYGASGGHSGGGNPVERAAALTA